MRRFFAAQSEPVENLAQQRNYVCAGRIFGGCRRCGIGDADLGQGGRNRDTIAALLNFLLLCEIFDRLGLRGEKSSHC